MSAGTHVATRRAVPASKLPVELPDQLLLRIARTNDRDPLAELLAAVHAAPDGTPNHAVWRWQRDLLDGGHPTVDAGEMLVVEDRRTGAVVSSFMMIPQTWTYAGVELPVRLLELAATHPDYRGRGLLKRQLEVLVTRSAERGDLLQGMTDILFFGPDIGFHTAITQRAGRGGYVHDLPPAPSSGEPVAIRRASLDDLHTLTDFDHRTARPRLLACIRDESQWRHELSGRSPDSMVHSEILVVDGANGPVGYMVIGYGGIPSFPIPTWLPGLPCPEPWVSIARYELLPGTPWLEVTPSVLRQLAATRLTPQGCPPDGYMLWLGADHPAYAVLGDLLVRRPPHIGWFLRVPDLVTLLRQLRSVLERRLQGTAGEGFTGDLKLHLYTQGVLLSFRNGVPTTVERWPQYSRRAADASLPEQMLLQLLLGHATWDELSPAFPDCRLQTITAQVLLPELFPKQGSDIWPLI